MSDKATPPMTLNALRVLVLGMMAGILAFAGVAMAIAARTAAPPDLAAVLLPVLGLVGVAQVPAYIVLRGRVLASLRRSLRDSPTAGDSEG